MNSDVTCKNLLSAFIDTFVDFCVAEIFLPSTPSPPFSQTTYPPPDRLIAVGDLHGDLSKAKQALRLAGLIDASDNWSGASTTLVQVGDVLDRGGHELKILYFLEKLKRQALKYGGNVITINGNHEIMNVDCQFHCTSLSGLEEFQNWAYWYTFGNNMKRLCNITNPNCLYDGIPSRFSGIKKEYFKGIRARIAALRPGGPIATRFLSNNLTVAVVGDSVFVHGGVLAQHVEYGLDQINNEVRDWIMGLKDGISSESTSVVWNRKFSNKVAEDCDCGALEHALATIPGARRMVMGHTIQRKGINMACNDKAVRIDVGMSKGCIDGLPQVLEISGDSNVRILTSKAGYDLDGRDLASPVQRERLEVQVEA